MMQTPVLHAEGLVRSFGGRRVVDQVSFTLEAGACLALFGPNGAGKTTLLRLVAGLLAPQQGAVHVNGVPLRHGPAARAQVGLVSHASMLYGALTVRENVQLAARLYGLADPAAAALSAQDRGADIPSTFTRRSGEVWSEVGLRAVNAALLVEAVGQRSRVQIVAGAQRVPAPRAVAEGGVEGVAPTAAPTSGGAA